MGSATQTRYGAAESSGRTDTLSPLEQHPRVSESFVFFVGVCQSAPHQSLAVRSRFLEGCLVVFPSSSSSIVVVVHRPSSSSSSIVVVITHHRHHTLLPSHSPLYSHVIAILILVLSSSSHHHPRLIFVRHGVIAAYPSYHHCVIAAYPTYHHCLFSYCPHAHAHRRILVPSKP